MSYSDLIPDRGVSPQTICRECSFRPDAAGTLHGRANGPAPVLNNSPAAASPSPLEGVQTGDIYEQAFVKSGRRDFAGWAKHLFGVTPLSAPDK